MTEEFEVQEGLDSVATDAPTAADAVDGSAGGEAEKMLPQSHVNKIVARSVREAQEKTRQAAHEQFEREKSEFMASMQGGGAPASAATNSQEMGRMFQQWVAQSNADRIVQEFNGKINNAIYSDPEFSDLYDNLDITNNPEMVLLVNSVDNTAEVLKELAKNPGKFAQILMLTKGGNAKMAARALQDLDKSIKANQAAKNVKQPAQPLSQFKPSTVNGTGDGSLSVSDIRRRLNQ